MLKFLLLINIHMKAFKKEKVMEPEVSTPEVSVEELQGQIDFLVKESIQHRTQMMEDSKKITSLENDLQEKTQDLTQTKIQKDKILKIAGFLVGVCYAKQIEIPQEMQRELRIDLSNSSNYNCGLGGKGPNRNITV